MKRLLLTVLLLAAVSGALTYRTALRHDREYRAYMARGDQSLASDQVFGALEAYSGALALRSDSMLAHLRRGETYQRLGDLDAAARDLTNATQLDSSATRPLEELGDVRYAQSRFREAGELYARYLRLDDRAGRLGYKLALARYREGNVSAALTAADAALKSDEQSADALYVRGLCLRDDRKPRDAQLALEKAVALAPGFIPAREELADLYGALQRRGEELEQLQVLAGLDHNRIERRVAIGLAHARWALDPQESEASRAAQADVAVLTLGSALERAPDHPLVYAALGRVWLDISKTREDPVALNKAIAALERAATSDAATSEWLSVYARALLQAGRVDQAEQALQQATDRYPVDLAAFPAYASVAERQNHPAAAREALMRYDALISDARGFPDRAAQIAALSLKLNSRDDASDWLRRGLEKSPDHPALLALQRRIRGSAF